MFADSTRTVRGQSNSPSRNRYRDALRRAVAGAVGAADDNRVDMAGPGAPSLGATLQRERARDHQSDDVSPSPVPFAVSLLLTGTRLAGRGCAARGRGERSDCDVGNAMVRRAQGRRRGGELIYCRWDGVVDGDLHVIRRVPPLPSDTVKRLPRSRRLRRLSALSPSHSRIRRSTRTRADLVRIDEPPPSSVTLARQAPSASTCRSGPAFAVGARL